MSLSLCMIVRDEAENLPSCLNSVKTAVDEMVVLDTGSRDETVAIAQSFGAQVHHFDWCDDFSAARNAALQYVTGDWILVLDADERLDPGIVPKLKQVMQLKNCLVVNLVRQEIGAAQSPYSLVSRLFRRHPEIQFSRPYHAMVDDSVASILQREPRWQVVELPDVAILHEGYQAGAIASRDKLQKARMTMERFLAKHPGDPYVCSKLGALYVQINKVNYGIELLERGLKSRQADPPVRYELHYHLGIAYSRLQHLDQAGMHYQSAIKQPILPRLKLGAYNNLGNLRKASGDLTGAKAVYEQALRVDPSFVMGHYNLGMVLKAMGQLEEAIAHYQQAIQLNPNYAEAYQNLGVTLLKLGKVAESLAAFERAIALHQQHDPAEAQRLRQGLQEMGFQV
jgi:tetratricopeptide (TPR) repeat protein